MAERGNSEFSQTNADKFNDFINRAGLFEYNMGGHKFTYMSDHGDKLSKLDRILVCKDFLDKWPTALVLALDRKYSDHSPVVFYTRATDFGHIPFRFFNSWLERPGFVEEVFRIGGNFVFSGPADLRLAVKLKWLKNRIKDWIKRDNESQNNNYENMWATVSDLEGLANSRNLNEEEMARRMDAKKEIADVDRLRALDNKQKSRVKWAINGDENTKFFHGIIKANTANNRLNGLLMNGNWIFEPVILKEKCKEYFESKYAEPIPIRPNFECPNLVRLSGLEADSLVTEFTMKEVETAVKDCAGEKAPGPDGFNFKFIKTFWELLKHDFMRLFQEFFV